MRRQQLERHLVDHGCEALREGAKHTIWHNPARDARAPVPRHRETDRHSARDLPPALDSAATWPALTTRRRDGRMRECSEMFLELEESALP